MIYGKAHFAHMRLPADMMVDLQIAAVAADLSIKESNIAFLKKCQWNRNRTKQKIGTTVQGRQ